jgi:hypothetical protein
MNSKKQAILSLLQANGATHSRQLLNHFGIRSRATLAKRIKELGDTVVTIGKASSTHYAAKNPGTLELPLYTISKNGKPQHLGALIPLANGEWYLESDSKIPSLFHGEFKDGFYPGWPWFLADLRPSGFLGRAFACRMARLLDFDTNPENWTDLNVARALSMFGSNLPGNFITGERPLIEFQERTTEEGSDYYKNSGKHAYPEFAKRALEDGSSFGSSAGGEQPKFTTYVNRGNEIQSVIVKFSPPFDEPAGRRWADLLITEQIANEILSANGFETAKTAIHEIEGRVFLESERFDRHGAAGRRGLVSLRALDAAFVGQGSGTWNKCAHKLKSQKLITEEASQQIVRLECFGHLIANTDMHFGNLSFFLGETFPLQLAPCYDMLPMHFRPSASGEVPTVEFQPKRPLPEREADWQQMHPLAVEFWQTVAQDSRISKRFQAIAEKNESKLNSLS